MSGHLAQPLLRILLMFMIENVRFKIYDFLSCCLYCHQINVGQKILCQHCWQVIEKYVGKNHWVKESIPFHALIDWKAYKSDIVSALALNLKENRNPAQWKYLAWQLLKMNTQIQLTANTVIVPAPAKLHKGVDHAFLLAQALCEITNLPFKNILLRSPSEVEQKTKNHLQRRQTLILNTEKNSKYNDVIFVDDIVTTGSTALAAYKALNNPQYYQVVSLIHRTR